MTVREPAHRRALGIGLLAIGFLFVRFAHRVAPIEMAGEYQRAIEDAGIGGDSLDDELDELRREGRL